MALFKIKKGKKSNLPSSVNEGTMYITQDEKKAYVDIDTSATSTADIKRIALNAVVADKVHYCTCVTAANVANKIILLQEDDYVDGSSITAGFCLMVWFQNSNTAANPTITLQNTSTGTQIEVQKGSENFGSKSIYRYYSTSTSYAVVSTSTSSSWSAGRVVTLIYDGIRWLIVNGEADANTIGTVYCTTSAATAAKVGTSSYYTLVNKSYLIIQNYYTNTAQSALTLNINNKGAKPIYINGAASSSSNYTLPSGSYLIYYDGTGYHFRTDGMIPGPLYDTVTNMVSAGTAAPSSSTTGTIYLRYSN